MSNYDLSFDINGALSRWGRVEGVVEDSARETLNDIAMRGGDEDRKQAQRVFTLRNKWIYNSIWPKHGKKFGLIPSYKRNINKMFSRAGSINEDLAQQEEGWQKTDPVVPSSEARISRKENRVIAKRFRMNHLDKNKALRASKAMDHIPDHRDRIEAFLAFVHHINWKGMIYMEDDSVMPEGFYKFRRRSLKLIRRTQHGVKKRRAIPWHAPAMRNLVTSVSAQTLFNSHMYRQISKLSG